MSNPLGRFSTEQLRTYRHGLCQYLKKAQEFRDSPFPRGEFEFKRSASELLEISRGSCWFVSHWYNCPAYSIWGVADSELRDGTRIVLDPGADGRGRPIPASATTPCCWSTSARSSYGERPKNVRPSGMRRGR